MARLRGPGYDGPVPAVTAIDLTVEDMVAEGDAVAVRYTERGRFVDPFRGADPTGKPFELVAMEWFVLREGRDSASQARQIGMPPPT